MQLHHRDLLAALVTVLFSLLALLAWGAFSRLRPGPAMAVAGPAGEAAPPISAPGARVEAASPPSAAAQTAPRPGASAGPLRVHVVGAVRNAAVYTLPRDARVIDAVTQAGGATADADLERINLADFLKDGEQVRIPRKNERPRTPEPPRPRAAASARPTSAAPPPASLRSTARYPRDEATAAASAGAEAAAPAPAAASAAGGKVNLNTATAAELDTLPGVGPATAAAILEYRRRHGRFMRVEEIMEVRGIGEKKFAAMKERLTVH